MSIVDEIESEIVALYEKLREIQDHCSHPDACVKRTNKGDTGNYDPHDDAYWTECKCSLCGKFWIEDQ